MLFLSPEAFHSFFPFRCLVICLFYGVFIYLSLVSSLSICQSVRQSAVHLYFSCRFFFCVCWFILVFFFFHVCYFNLLGIYLSIYLSVATIHHRSFFHSFIRAFIYSCLPRGLVDVPLRNVFFTASIWSIPIGKYMYVIGNPCAYAGYHCNHDFQLLHFVPNHHRYSTHLGIYALPRYLMIAFFNVETVRHLPQDISTASLLV